MIALLSRARRRIADALDARTLARTVIVLQRQLDHAHLAGQIEEARADRAEAAAEHAEAAMRTIAGMLDTAGIGRRERDTTAVRLARMIADANTEAERTEKAEDRIEELERALADWRLQSGELVAEQAADDLPDLAPNDDGGPPSPLPADPYARAEIQAKRADALERHRIAAEAHATDLESELATVRAQLRQTERSAGAHLATIEALREELAEALQDAAEMKELARRTIFTQEQPLTCRSCGGPCEEDRRCYARPTCHRCLPPPPALDVLQIPGVADTPPETQPSARIATREEPRP